MTDTRFSVLKYAADHADQHRQTNHDGGERQRWFERLIKEIRDELADVRGKDEQERLAYNHLLNRAVLGYAEERRLMMAMIEELLLKRQALHAEPPNVRYGTMSQAVFAEVIGMNVLELILLDREDLEEIQVVGTHVFEVRSGRVTASLHRFSDMKEVMRIQQNLILYNKDVFNPRKRWAEAMLSDGARVTMTGFGFTDMPTLTIRFFPLHYFRLAELTHPDTSTLNSNMCNVLQALVQASLNLVIIGPTNSGKTHLIKALIGEVADEERIVTIEGRFEMRLKQLFPDKNIIEYEVDEEDEQHSSLQAFKLALRQSPRRIIHAEIRDHDANIYVRACTRGHAGSMTTLHADTLEDVPEAIADMCMLDGRGMDPARLVRRIAQYVTQIGVEMALIDGKRKIVRIAELSYTDSLQVRDLYRYDYQANSWQQVHQLSKGNQQRMLRLCPHLIPNLQRIGVAA